MKVASNFITLLLYLFMITFGIIFVGILVTFLQDTYNQEN